MNVFEKKLTGFISDNPDIDVAFLFGSQVTGITHRESDVDIALLFDTEKVPGTNQILQIEDHLISTIKRDVDIVILNNASPVIRMQVLKKGKKILENDHQAYLRFFVKTINEYDDLKRVRQVNEINILQGRIYG